MNTNYSNYCIYRKPKTLELSNCNYCAISEGYCLKHFKYMNNIFKIINEAIKDKININSCDIYKFYKYIYDSTNDEKESLFLKIISVLSRNKLLKIYEKYDTVIIKKNKTHMLRKIVELNAATYKISQKKINSITKIQKYYIKNKYIITYDITKLINIEDIFTFDKITDIPVTRLFMFYDSRKNLYGFDAIELEYFIRNCDETPYNPYTKEEIDNKVIYNLEKFIRFNNLKKRNIENVFEWASEIQAYTDLSIEIEKRGFYNSPNWFKIFDRELFVHIIKIFRDFSGNIPENRLYFQNVLAPYNQDKKAIIFEFCREGIRLFKECYKDNYVLCCNFIKSLAMCSQDFYNNIPEWLLNTETTSSILQNNFNSLNLLFFYYVEYL